MSIMSLFFVPRFGFPREIPRNSHGKGNFYQLDVISATEFSSAVMATAQKSRGNPAEMPREVKNLAIARTFRGNGDLNPALCFVISRFPASASESPRAPWCE